MNILDDYKAGGANWTPRLEKGASSKHQAIFEALVADIASGRLRLGDRLPPQRAVAAALGVDLTTVTKAYSRARSEGIIEASTGRGSFVAVGSVENRVSASSVAPLDLSRNSPPRCKAVDTAFSRELDHALSTQDDTDVLNYQDTGGNWTNRTAGATWLSRRLGFCPPDRVVLTSGAQSALFAVCHLLSRKNRHVAVGQFSYPGIHTVAFQQGLQLIPLAMDGHGIAPDAFAEACDRTEIGMLYITPTADNPTTTTMPSERREEIIQIARRHGVSIIEDDPYHDLVTNPPPPIAAHAPDLAWHIATLSKCTSPSLRLGYVAAPNAESSAQIAATLQAMTMMASPLFAAVASRWIYSGYHQEAALLIAEENVRRQTIAANLFQDCEFEADRRTPHMWLRLPAPWRANDFVHQCERLGVIVLGSPSFSVNSPISEAVRISVGAAPSQKALEDALNTLRAVLTKGHLTANRAMV
ncbi:PLP-dependent aminotransferase family protein [Rhizobium sp. WYJ-E13]|uniref:aminotransferase-like domain-containing protein n=1 Tax=Rhizobium sp. WYJ-E13 TaxID=2849093 RepID=UPI001C1EEE84|nr:PLP-dependent aminotransferase family protein [Rhizobium sp. WYJ-E13]QWW72402.1 PLP-dependent aminotransferase family protein [Rhizobium sp. WYJ-E13]